MTRVAYRASIFLIAALFTGTASAQGVKFSDLVGWWSAEPSFAGESSRVLLHFVDEGEKQSARLTLADIGAYDIPIGEVVIKGEVVEPQALSFPLTYEESKRTLTGVLPAEVVPVYRISAVFTRSEPLEKPAAPVWSAPQPKVKWRTNVGAPVWAGLEHDTETDAIFVGTDAGVLHAIDVKGQTRWTFDTAGPIKARPAVIDDALFVASDSGYLYKLDKRTGKERWRARIDAGSPERIPVNQPKSRWDRYGSSIVADAERVYVGSRDTHVYALDRATGREQWRVASKDLITATPALYGDLLVFGSFDGSIQAVNATDGDPRWRYESQQPITGDLVVDGDRVLAGGRSYDLIALDARTGTERWKHYYWFSWIESPPVVRDGVIYTGSSDATGVFAIDANTGARRWKASVPGYAWARPAVSEKIVVSGTVGQGPHPSSREGALVGIERVTGKIVWIHLEPPSAEVVEKKVDWGFAASPIIVGDIAYAADLNGWLYALDTR